MIEKMRSIRDLYHTPVICEALSGMSNTATALKILSALVKEALKRDGDHGYRLMENYAFLLKFETPKYEDDLWMFAPLAGMGATKVVLKFYDYLPSGKPVNDGATFAPDKPAKALATFHDPGYLRIKPIAAAWQGADCAPYGGKWDEAKVRRMFDDIGGDAMRKLDRAPNWLVRTYYTACRRFGGLFKKFKPVFLAAALAFAGCGGCLSPPDCAEFPDGFPKIEKIPATPPEDFYNDEKSENDENE